MIWNFLYVTGSNIKIKTKCFQFNQKVKRIQRLYWEYVKIKSL